MSMKQTQSKLEQFLETKIRQVIKEEMTQIFTIVKTFNGQHPRDIAVYFDQKLANKICQILQQNSKNENYSEEINYKVESGKSATPVKKNK